jgi:hypothetical protein
VRRPSKKAEDGGGTSWNYYYLFENQRGRRRKNTHIQAEMI